MATAEDTGLEGRLTRWLRGRMRAEAGTPVHAVRVHDLHKAGVGQSSETTMFDASWTQDGRPYRGQFVLRLQQGLDGIFMRPDAAREFRVLAALRSHSQVPVPRVRWLEQRADVLGAPFFVMERVSGVVPSGKPSTHAVGWLPTLDPAQRRALWQSAIDTLAAVHAVDWRRSHAFLHPDPDTQPGLESHLDHTARWYRWATRGRAFPITDTALDYLLDHRRSVRPGEPVLLWGDARLGNTMFSRERPPTVVAVLDWEVATIGPAAVDVAHWLIFDEFATSACGVRRLAGYPDRAETIARYEAVSGRALDDIEYFETLQCLFLATTLIRQTDAAVNSGRFHAATRMAHDNTVTQMLARRLGLPEPELAEDYLRHRQPACSVPSSEGERFMGSGQ